jgi:hypothetical protein
MPTTYKFVKGDKLEEIGRKYGHRDWRTIWRAPENKFIVLKRGKPENLQPGDTIVIPPNEKESSRLNGALKTKASLEEDLDRIKRKLKLIDELIVEDKKNTDSIVKELEGNLRGMKSTAENVDLVWFLADLTKSLVKLTNLGFKSVKATEEGLKEVNKEALKQVSDLQREHLTDATVKVISTYKDRTGTALGYLGVLADSWDKMHSPSFWFYAVTKLREGKGLSEAMTSEIGDEIESRIKQVTREGERRNQKLQEMRKKIEAEVMETRALLRGCELDLKQR